MKYTAAKLIACMTFLVGMTALVGISWAGVCDDSTPCVPGKGSPKTDCYHEWAVDPVPPNDPRGFPSFKVAAVDGDSDCTDGACDQDGTDGMCTFKVALCLNADDSRLVKRKDPLTPVCTPRDVSRYDFKKPNPSNPKDTDDTANLAALTSALGELGGTGAKECANMGMKGTPCTQDSDCDIVPGDGTGKCRSFVTFSPANSTVDACSSVQDLVVTLRSTPSGLKKTRKTLKIKATTSPSTNPDGNPVAGKPDSDILKLTCCPVGTASCR